MQCGLELVPDAGRSIGYAIKPRHDFPVATGRLCQKGLNVLDHVVHPERLTEPHKKSSEGWVPSSWDHALGEIANQIKQIQADYGKDAVAVYGGGSLTNEVCYLLGKFTRIALGSKYIDYNGRYCMSSAAAASNQAFGLDRGMTMPLSEIPNAKYIILAGTNIAECQPTMVPYLLEAKKNGAVIVTIDPRNTMTSKLADIHVRLQPGFDSVFVNGLLHVIVQERLYAESFIKERTVGLEQLVEAVKPFTPARVEELTGILEAVVRTIARGFARAETGIVLTARGLEQQVNGVENTLNYINLSLITGKIGRNGCGYGAVTGQANGQGGREHGQKADQLPGYRLIENPHDRDYVARIWGIDPDELPGKGVSAYEMLQKVDEGEIKAMIVLGSNPLVSSPNSRIVERALQKLELLVVVDLFETETARLAHWLLPGS
ncbi:MAG: nitrite reductase, partial [Paenibacillus sp.]|nr:nitrite reductase [Paenibacillus sp.]